MILKSANLSLISSSGSESSSPYSATMPEADVSKQEIKQFSRLPVEYETSDVLFCFSMVAVEVSF